MAESTNVVTLDDAGRNKISVSGVSGLAPSQVWGGGRVGPLRQIQQASEKFQDWHSSCEHSEKEGLRGGGNTIS